MLILQILLIIGLPFLLLKIERQYPWAKSIVLAYVLGVVVGNVVPDFFVTELLKEITGISIIIAIPLLLFPTHFKELLNQPKSLLLAYGLAVVSTTISVGIGYYLFKDELIDIAMISGMVEGVYTGGTVNLNAIGLAFSAPEELVVLLNGYDMAFSGIYLLAIFTFLPSILSKVLQKPSDLEVSEIANDGNKFEELPVRMKVLSVLKGLGLSVLILGLVAGFSMLWLGDVNELVVIFGVTALALFVSNNKSVREWKGNMITADYLMMIFGFTLGAQANIESLMNENSGLMAYFITTYALMLIIHLLLVKLFKIDYHHFLISSVAAVFGPPFIGPVAESLGNRSLITPGIIIALIGNAIGTYLGIIVVKILLE